MGRKAIHADPAARKAAYRAKFQRLDLPVDPELYKTLTRIAAEIDQPLTALCISMLKFSLANHDWARFGLTHKRTTQD
jgi:hypothetical protein